MKKTPLLQCPMLPSASFVMSSPAKAAAVVRRGRAAVSCLSPRAWLREERLELGPASARPQLRRLAWLAAPRASGKQARRSEPRQRIAKPNAVPPPVAGHRDLSTLGTLLATATLDRLGDPTAAGVGQAVFASFWFICSIRVIVLCLEKSYSTPDTDPKWCRSIRVNVILL
jgi:hypothetical protein